MPLLIGGLPVCSGPQYPVRQQLIRIAFHRRIVAGASGFVRLGFTDATIEELARSGALVLTDGFTLYMHLLECGAEAFNFTQLRGLLTL